MFPVMKSFSAISRKALSSGYKNGITGPLPHRGPLLSTLSWPPSTPEEEEPPTKNIRLEAIKSVGITQLHNHTKDLISRTTESLFETSLLDAHGHKRPSIAQIQEADRLESAIMEALDFYSSKHNTFSVGGQCIHVLGVEVSPDLRQAKAYWCLPHGLDLQNIPQLKLEQIVKKMQKILDERGGKIQAIVHTRLRAYYPPKIFWVAAEHISKDLKRGVSLENGKKKWR